MDKSPCARTLESEEMKPFWVEIERLIKSYQNDMRKTRDIAHLSGIEALEKVKDLPRVLAVRK